MLFGMLNAASTRNWPVIDGIRVDLEALASLAHRCDPMTCRHVGSCCSQFEVEVRRKEASRAVGLTPDAAKFANALVDEDGDLVDPIDYTTTGLCLATHESGLCLFAFHTRQGAVRCSLHAAALEHGMKPQDAKPRPCSLWPLVFDEDRDPPLLTVHDEALKFPCNRRRRGRTLNAGVQDLIVGVFGEDFLNAVEAEMSRIHT